MDPQKPFSDFQNEAFATLVGTTKTAGSIAAEDLSFHRSLNSSFANNLDHSNDTILGLVNQLLSNAVTESDLTAPQLSDADDVDTHWKDIIEIVDFLLERADTSLDDYTGAIKQKNPQNLSSLPDNIYNRSSKFPRVNPFKNRNLPKPQTTFTSKVDNNDRMPFKPLLTDKPHAIVPLEDSIRSFTDERLRTQYQHPYQVEVERLSYPPAVYTSNPPIQYLPFESTTAIYVQDKESLIKMMKDLKEVTEIAIDLEHHNDRSFVGFVCLMQISTRQQDWIVDTLQLREELQALNEVFADPKIIKILHGAFMDIIWLQRDFGLYIVGLFDTYEASRTLGFASKSLAFLLKKYVGFDADKRYQLADWRIRPLPQEMLDYARSDTHFLLYIYDMVRNELIERSTTDHNLISEVLTNSKETSLRRYEKEEYDPVEGSGQFGWSLMLRKSPALLNPQQLAVFKAIHQWRDKVAREDDESHHFVMSKHQLYNLARMMPEDVPGVLSACHPPSPAVRNRVGEIVSLIKTACDAVPNSDFKQPTSSTKPSVSLPTIASPPSQPQSSQRVLLESFDIFSSNLTSIQATESNFWGKASGSSQWESSYDVDTGVLAIPIPQLIQKTSPKQEVINTVFADSTASSTPDIQLMHETSSEKVITIASLKEAGGVRKRKRPNGQDSAQNISSIDADRIVEKRGPNLLKKVQLQSTEKIGNLSTDVTEELEFFDYSTAPSILKADKDAGLPSGKRPTFNPYNKASGPKGGKTGRREKDGKTFTFKR